MTKKKFTITEKDAGQRMDKVLAHLFPQLGLRVRRRLCTEAAVLLNGHSIKESYKVRCGDIITLPPSPLLPADNFPSSPSQKQCAIIKQDDDFAALYKPVGMHTAAIAGKNSPCLEHELAHIFSNRKIPQLLNRLDFATSGLVIAAFTDEGATRWNNAFTTKRYLALLEGSMEKAVIIRNKLDMDNRKNVRPLAEDDPDISRHTEIMPLATLPIPASFLLSAANAEVHDAPELKKMTLAGCTIARGARHQIRVHAAAAGFPLLGDEKYGATRIQFPHPFPGTEQFILHHGWIETPFFQAFCPPSWEDILPDLLLKFGQDWLLGSLEK